jgi:hypothetical protein
MPSGGDDYVPTLENTASLFVSLTFRRWWSFANIYRSFGAEKQSDGTWTHVPERIPENWTNRVTPYSLLDVSAQIAEMYGTHPVGFGGNVNGAFVGLDFPPYIEGGSLLTATPSDYACLLYQLISGPIPSSLNSVVTPTVEALQFVLTTLGGETFTNLGCPIPLTK